MAEYRPVVVWAVVAFAVVGWLGLGSSGILGPSSGARPGATGTGVSATGASPSGPTPSPVSTATSPSNAAQAMASRALAAVRAAGLSPDVISVPRPSATPAQVAESKALGAARPLYTGDPAPMGLADYGINGNGEGSETYSIVNTTALLGFVDANATGIQGEDLYQNLPDAFSVQLNAVLTNVQLFGVSGYSFWTQNIVTYYPSAETMVLLTNVWNFSAPRAAMTANSISAHGPFGTHQYAELGFYYAEEDLTTEITYPFNLTLALDSSVTGGANNVSFSVDLSSSKVPSEDFNDTSWDYVIFNSSGDARSSVVLDPSNFTANGVKYNPVNLTDDFELVIVGPGGGSQVDLSTADATLGLAYYVGTGFHSVPSAFNYGDETGETSTGASVAWSNLAGHGPLFETDYGTMSTGPSILTGLWGEGAPSGSDRLSIYVTPANAFNFLEYTGIGNFTSGFVEVPEFAPSMETRTFYLMPGVYRLKSELSDYSYAFYTIALEGSTVLNFTLKIDVAAGVYTPLWAFSNEEIAELSTSGNGIPSKPYELPNNQSAPLSSTFGLYNDYGFPVYPGVFLKGTTASTVLDSPPSFETETNTSQYPGEALPSTNDLQYWLWGVDGFALQDGTNISGWFADNGYYPFTFNSFNVVVYASENDLVAGNVFPTEAQALLMYAGVLSTPSDNATTFVGGNNTVWGNEFVETDPPPSCEAAPKCLPLLSYASGLGLELAESDDLVYNNLFDTPTTAWLAPLDIYSGEPAVWSGERWNITAQPASNVHYASGFPTIPLTGSVVDGMTQGGNSWWDYGVTLNWANGADNPTDHIPYDEDAPTLIDPLPGYGTPLPGYGCDLYYCATYIYSGGDYDPLATIAASVMLDEHGLLPNTTYGLQVLCGITHEGGGGGGGPSTPPCCGVLHEGGGGGGGAKGGGCGSGSGGGLQHEAGAHLAAGTGGNFAIADVETNASEVHLVLPDGGYLWSPSSTVGYTNVSGGTLNVSGTHPARIALKYHVAAGFAALSVHERGLPKGTPWKVDVGGTTVATDAFNSTVKGTRSTVRVLLLEGTYDYSVVPVPGYVPKVASGSFTLTKASALHIVFKVAKYSVTFSSSGLPVDDRWSVKVTGPIKGSGTQSKTISTRSTTLTFLLRNGSYRFLVSAPTGWSCSELDPRSGSGDPPACTNGTFRLSGLDLGISIAFSDPPGASPQSGGIAELSPARGGAGVAAARLQGLELPAVALPRNGHDV